MSPKDNTEMCLQGSTHDHPAVSVRVGRVAAFPNRSKEFGIYSMTVPLIMPTVHRPRSLPRRLRRSILPPPSLVAVVLT